MSAIPDVLIRTFFYEKFTVFFLSSFYVVFMYVIVIK